MAELTRKQVAARLGRSIATVRRLEGTVLHPRRDAHGVFQFSLDEVERLQCNPQRMQPYASSAWLQRRRVTSGRAPRNGLGRPCTQERAPAAIERIAQAVQLMVETAKPMRSEHLLVSLQAVEELLAVLADEL